MCKRLSAVLVVAVAMALVLPPLAASSDVPSLPPVGAAHAAGSLLFVQNVGQFAGQALGRSTPQFQVHTESGTVWLSQDGLWLTITRGAASTCSTFPDPDMQGAARARAERIVHVHVSFLGANPEPTLEPFAAQPVHVSYFVGNDPSRWYRGVPVWGASAIGISIPALTWS